MPKAKQSVLGETSLTHQPAKMAVTVARAAGDPAETSRFLHASFDQEDGLRDANSAATDGVIHVMLSLVAEELRRRERAMITEFMAQSQGR